MKIIRENVACLQFEDINYLLGREKSVDKPFFEEVSNIFDKIGLKLDDIDVKNKYSFIKFTNPASIDYIESVNCIVDYDEIKGLSLGELVNKSNTNDIVKSELINKIKSLSSEREIDICVQKVNDLIYKNYQIDAFLEYKRGYRKLELPEIVKLPRRKKKRGLLITLKNVFASKTN